MHGMPLTLHPMHGYVVSKTLDSVVHEPSFRERVDVVHLASKHTEHAASPLPKRLLSIRVLELLRKSTEYVDGILELEFLSYCPKVTAVQPKVVSRSWWKFEGGVISG